jgi:hypothetical protein
VIAGWPLCSEILAAAPAARTLYREPQTCRVAPSGMAGRRRAGHEPLRTVRSVRTARCAESVVVRIDLDTQIDMQVGKPRHIAPAKVAAEIDVTGQVDNQRQVTATVGQFGQ